MKILVNIYIPIIEKKFDVFIPDFLLIKEIIELLISAIHELSDVDYISSGNEFLCLIDKKILLKENLTLYDYGVQNGDKLILM